MDGLKNFANMASNRFATNVTASFSALTLQQWIRLVAIVGAYLLLRPYILKLGAKVQMRQLEKEGDESEREAAAAAAAGLSPNDLRGSGSGPKVIVPDETDSEDEQGPGGAAGAATASGATDWGKKARRRQRHMVRKMLEQAEKKLAEEQDDEEDKEIEEFLVG